MQNKDKQYEVGLGGFLEVTPADGDTVGPEDLIGILRLLREQRTGEAKVVLGGSSRHATGMNLRRRYGYHGAELLSDLGLLKFREKRSGAAGEGKGGREVRITEQGREALRMVEEGDPVTWTEALAKTEAGLRVANQLADVFGRVLHLFGP